MSSQRQHQHMKSPPSLDDLRSLELLNSLLERCELPPINPESHARLLQRGIDQLRNFATAIQKAPSQVGAKQHVVNVIAELGQKRNAPEAAPPDVTDERNQGESHRDPKVSDIEQARAARSLPAARTDAPPGKSPARDQERKEYAYGKTAALMFETSRTRGGVHTLSMDAAKSVAQGTFDWDSKVTIQFTHDELPALVALFFGLVPEITFTNHGSDRNKSFTMRNQDGQVYVRVTAPGFAAAVPINPADAAAVSSLLVLQVLRGNPHLRDLANILMWVKHVYVRIGGKAMQRTTKDS